MFLHIPIVHVILQFYLQHPIYIFLVYQPLSPICLFCTPSHACRCSHSHAARLTSCAPIGDIVKFASGVMRFARYTVWALASAGKITKRASILRFQICRGRLSPLYDVHSDSAPHPVLCTLEPLNSREVIQVASVSLGQRILLRRQCNRCD